MIGIKTSPVTLPIPVPYPDGRVPQRHSPVKPRRDAVYPVLLMLKAHDSVTVHVPSALPYPAVVTVDNAPHQQKRRQAVRGMRSLTVPFRFKISVQGWHPMAPGESTFSYNKANRSRIGVPQRS